MKVGKNFEKRGQLQIHIRNAQKPVWREFFSLISKDRKLLEQQDERYKTRILSLAVFLLVRRYVAERRQEEQLEESNKTDDSKEAQVQ
jgi:hypothetical protein